jgi:acetyltransferase-like isoleucine patch superfamily enzyme
LTLIDSGLGRGIKGLLRPLVAALKRVDMMTPYCHGDTRRLHLGRGVSAVNTIFNVASGEIYIGDDTVFGHNCMVLTGRHEFSRGRRRSLSTGEPDTPTSGSDIHIGSGCWIASGVIVTGGVTVGDNTIIGAGAVVTLDIPSGVFAAGVPAQVIRQLQSSEDAV